ncbi:FeoB-associated Cys-rich membrane protein [Clostridium oceanicum]|uniref:Virus attachment protein p12 family protein n=1 Tax=Clostridium oceanicum TaxID=1543 RepID=A0ABN1J9C2_9CLOT
MSNIVVLVIILTIIAASITKIVIEKKKGVKCIGCPCSGSKDSKCNCHISK